MPAQKPLSEHEKRYLRAFKLFLDVDPKRSEVAEAFTGLSPKTLDKLSPNKQRSFIKLYHMALEDPETFLLVQKVTSKILRPFSRNRS